MLDDELELFPQCQPLQPCHRQLYFWWLREIMVSLSTFSMPIFSFLQNGVLGGNGTCFTSCRLLSEVRVLCWSFCKAVPFFYLLFGEILCLKALLIPIVNLISFENLGSCTDCLNAGLCLFMKLTVFNEVHV